MGIKIANNATGQLAADITDSDLALSVKAGQGALFPTLSAGDFFYCTIQKSNGDFEIIKVTARTSDTFTTIVRAQDGTIARSFGADDIVSLRPCRAVILDLQAGTPEASFQIDSDNSGPRIKNSSGAVFLRNAADSAYAGLSVLQLSITENSPTQAYHATRKDYVDPLVAAVIPSGTKMYFYQNTAPTGWTIDNAVADVLLAVKGGTSTYNVSGGVLAGSWAQPSHTHTGPSHSHASEVHYHNTVAHYHSGPYHSHSIPNHNHLVYYIGNANAMYYDSGGNLQYLTYASRAYVGLVVTASSAFSSVNNDMYTSNGGSGSTGNGGNGSTGYGGGDNTGYSGYGSTGAAGTGATGSGATTSTYRPHGAVGIIATKN